MIDGFLNFFKNLKIKYLFTQHNKFYFGRSIKSNKSKILVEFNSFHNTHIPISYLSNLLAKKYGSEIEGFFNYTLISASLNNTLINKIKWHISNLFSLNNFKLYRSFGVKNIFRPSKLSFYNQKSENIYKDIYKKLKKKEDIINIKFNNIVVGDLIYDTYLKFYREPTLELNDLRFKRLLKDFIDLHFFWLDYLKKNKIKAIVGVHTPYSYGLILRIGVNKKIPTFVTSSRFIYRLDKKMQFMHGNFNDYPKDFKKFSKKNKIVAMKLAHKRLNFRFSGISGAKADLITTETSTFHKKKLPLIIKKNNKIKILIAPHDFFDAVHVWGKILFSDFYEWLIFLGKMSNETNYDWYIKNRPNYSGKFKIYQPLTNKIIKKIIKKYPKIKLIPNYYSHKQLINEKINYVLTCYGSVAMEYAYHKIPVINASNNNPHIKYNFNYNPKNINEYKYFIKNLEKLKNKKLNFSKNKILEYYFMRHLYTDKSWLFDNLEEMINSVGGYDGQFTPKIYKYWLKKFSIEKHDKIIISINRFLDSKSNSLNIIHTKKFDHLLNQQ